MLYLSPLKFNSIVVHVVRINMSSYFDSSLTSQATKHKVISYGKILVNLDSCTVTYEGIIITLNPKEYQLLLLFLSYPNHVLNYDFIIDKIWGIDKYPTQSNIRSHIKGLRKAFNKVDSSAKIIETVHGIGYRLKPLGESQLNHPIISPSISVLKKLVKAKTIEYIVIDEELILQCISPNALNYCDYPQLLKIGNNAEEAFPELVGLGGIFKNLLDQESEISAIKGIARATNPNRPEYINFYLMVGDSDSLGKGPKKLLFVFFEDASESMLYKQRFVQLRNAIYLILENRVLPQHMDKESPEENFCLLLQDLADLSVNTDGSKQSISST